MKYLTLMILAFSACAMSLSAGRDVVLCEKTYVSPEQIHFEDSSIFVDLGEIWIEPTSLHVDEGGIYLRQIQGCPGPWQCHVPGCHAFNPQYAQKCWQCKTPRQTHGG